MNTSTDSDSTVTIGMASIPGRSEGLRLVLRSLLPYCDAFDVQLNGYPDGWTCPELDDPKVTVYRAPDIGARGKLRTAFRTAGYYLTVDDDIHYPPEYVQTVVSEIERFGRQAVVGYHGTVLTLPRDAVQPQSRVLYHHMLELPVHIPVHMLGTGCMGWHSSAITLDWRRMEPGKIDEQVAIQAQEERVPMICLPRPAGWLPENNDLKLVNSLRRNMEANREAYGRRTSRQWHIFLPDNYAAAQRYYV
jgi:hypothetical protein